MRAIRILLEWAIPWLILSLGLSVASSEMAPKVVVVTATKDSHINQFCSTWGNFHYKTLDGDFFQLPSTCNYILTSQCKSSYESFNIQLQRQEVDGIISIKKILMKLDGIMVELGNAPIKVMNTNVSIPFSQSGISIEETMSYIKVEAKLGLVLMWNQKDSLWVELDAKFKNQTCGLCGDFNEIKLYDEFIQSGTSISSDEYAGKWKVEGPTETCNAVSSHTAGNCSDETDLCKNLLNGPAFRSCGSLIDTESFIKACVRDLCACKGNDSACLCSTVSEYSRQCAHAGGHPQQWKTTQLCEKTCPFNMEYKECGSPCTDTCRYRHRKQLCDEHCIDGCFCPRGTIFNDISQNGCVPVEQCPCFHKAQTYNPGESVKMACRNCTCSKGEWSCTEVNCPAICSIRGGSHFSTFDDNAYTFHGKCSYVLSKENYSTFTVLGDFDKCEKSDKSTCLSAVTLLYQNQTTIEVKDNGVVVYNQQEFKLPLFLDDIKIFRPSTFFIIIHTSFGLDLEIQLVPIMQLYIRAGVSLKGNVMGLCGDFNDNSGDDFTTTSGLLERTAVALANTWRAKPRLICPDVKTDLADPCSLSIEKEKYAKTWCSQLTSTNSIFAACHSKIDPEEYKTSCIYDTCACENSEDCLCASLSSYVHACAAEDVILKGWRKDICSKYTADCPRTFVYKYDMTSCGRTCSSLSQSDFTCEATFTPVDGCGCAKGTFLNEKGECVPASECSCQVGKTIIQPGDKANIQGQVCSCHSGKLSCEGEQRNQTCTSPKVFFNCSNAKSGEKGSECQKSCQTVDTECVSSQCVPGCVCPNGLLSNGKGGCVREEDCPCPHNGIYYDPGAKITVDCNKCTCKNRKWECTDNDCGGTCTIYGEGHYITFDKKRFAFKGDCGYIFSQDYCGDNVNGTFRVRIENIPCIGSESICSTSITLYLGSNEILLSDENVKVISQGKGMDVPFKVHTMGIYIVIEANNGLVLIWNRKTTLMIKLSSTFKGKVCGLCGNYDGAIKNDFTTGSSEIVINPAVFGNSWKLSSTCPDVNTTQNPCSLYSHRRAWSEKHCNIIKSEVFSACHDKVEPSQYYDACVTDTCACNTGGDCECFCSAVGAYAAACNEAGACVKWRTPTICPLFCDYYNPDGECEWHYAPCGKSCMKTCRNPSGKCYNKLPALEGCYPTCPLEQPYFDEVAMKCVSGKECGCFDKDGTLYKDGDSMPSREMCHKCYCTSTMSKCVYDVNACICVYMNNTYKYGEKVYGTHDGDGTCMYGVCGENGTIIRKIIEGCHSTTTEPTTVFIFTTTERTKQSISTSKPIPNVTTQAVTTILTFSTPRVSTKSRTTPLPIISSYPSSSTTTLTENLTTTLVPKTPHTENRSTRPETSTTTPITTQTTSIVNPTTTPIPTTISTTASETTTPGSCYICNWSKWTNNDYPGPSLDEGDYETIANISDVDLGLCKKPLEIQCRSKDYPDMPLKDLDQQVTCSPAVGLVCNNKDQKTPVGHCYDYEIRVRCCIYKCETTTTITATSPQRETTTPITQTKQPETTPIITEKTTSKPYIETSTSVTQTEKPTTTTTVTDKSKTPQPETPTPSTGTRTPQTMTVFTEKVTTKPYTETTTKETEKTSTKAIVTEKSTTLHIVTAPPITGTETPKTAPIITGEVTTTHYIETSTSITQTKKPTTTTTVTDNYKTPQPETTTPSTGTKTPQTMTVFTTSKPYIETTTPTMETEKPTTTITITEKSTTSHIGTTTQTTSIVNPTTTPIPTTISTTASETTTPDSCYICNWSKWTNNDYPGPSLDEGDYETIANISDVDLGLCKKPLEIQCRSKDYPDMPLKDLDQQVTCSPAVGLVCNNKDQKTPVGHCYDYEIRVRCCIYKCETTTTITATSPQRETTTPITQTKQPETTPIITEKTTSKPYIETSTSVTQTEKPTTTTTVTDKSKTPQPETTTPSTGTRTPQTMTVFTEKVTTKPYTETTTKETEKTSTKAIVTEKSTTLHIVTAPPITGTETPKTAPIITGEVTTTHYIETSTSITQTKKPTTTTTVTDNYKTPQPETTTPSTGTKTPQTMTVFTTSKPYIETTTPTMETEKPTTTITITEKSTTSHIGTTTQTTSIVNPTTTPIPTTISTTASETTTPDSCYICNWSKWTNNDYPGPSLDEGDYETIANISDVDLGLCKKPLEIQCRSKDYPDMPLKDLDQQVTCSPAVGLVCNNKDQKTPVGHCYDYEIRVRCCIYKCETTTTITATSPQRETTTPITQTKQPETTPIITEKTTSKPYIETSTSVTQTEKPTTTTTVTDKSKTPQPETTTPSTGTRTPQTMTVFTEKVTTKPYTETTTKETEKTSTKAIVTEKSTTLHIVTAPPITGTETPKTAPIITGEVTTTHYIETSTSITQTKKPTTTTTVTDNYKTPQPETTTPSTGTKTPQTMTVFTTSKPYIETTTPTMETEKPTTTITITEKSTTSHIGTTTQTTSIVNPTTTPIPTTISTTASETTTPDSCYICNWSKWTNNDYPGPSLDEGDYETIANISDVDLGLCKKPLEIQCRSKDYPDMPLKDLDQQVTCSPAVGLVCNNKDQKTPVGHCYDYEIRVRCCIYKCETTTTITATSPQRETTTPITQTKQPETTPIITEKTTSKPYIETSTSVTQTEKPTTTTTVTDKSKTPQPETTTPSTGTRTPQTMTVFTEKVTTKPYTETTTKETEKTSTKASVTEKSTTLHIVTAPPITGTETPKTAPIITGEVTTTHYIETSTSITQTKKPTTTTTVTDNYKTPQPETTTPSTGTKTPQTMTVFTTSKPYIETTTPTMETEKPTTTITITEKSTTSHIGTTTQTTSIVNPTTTPIPTTISTTASETTTPDSCYICNWSKWTNNDYPGPSLDEGDYETIANISDVDLGLCKKPLEIQCRSKDYPDMPLKDLDQQVTCSPAVGLVCNNKDQKTPVGHCYDYEIRVRCCIYKCETTTTITATSPQRETTTPITQTKQPETTPIITEKTTSKPYIETSTSVTQTEKPTTTTTVTDKSKTPQPETTTPSTGTRTPQTMTVFTEKVTTKPYTETTTKETEKTSTKAIVTEKSTTLHIVTAPPITGTETPKTAPIITGEVTTTHYIETSTSITQTKKPTTTTTVTDNYKTPQPETTTPSTGTKTPQTMTVFTTSKPYIETTTPTMETEKPTTTITITEKSTTSHIGTTTQTTSIVNPTTTPIPTTISTTASETTTPDSCYICNWSKWTNNDYPGPSLDEGDYETIANISDVDLGLCKKPLEIQCRSKDYPDMPLKDLDQQVTCSPAVGLVCNNKDQKTPVGHCYDYEIRVRCCIYKCETTTTITATSPQRETTTPITQTKQPETTPIITEKTTSKPYIETSTSVTQTEKPTTTTTVTDKSKTPQPETTTPSTGTRTPQTMTVFTEKVTTKPYTETTTKETEKTSTKASVTEKSTTLHIVTAPPITGTETPKTAPIITGEVTTTHYIETSTSITQTKKPTTTTTVTDNYKTPQPETTTPSTGTKTPQTMTVFTTSKPYIETTTPTMETEKPTTTITITEKSTTSHIGTTTQTTSIVNPTTTPIPTTISTTASETTTPDSCYICNWSKWTNNDYPGPSLDEGDYETIANISDVDLGLCKKPLEIQCRSKDYPDMPLKDLDQQVTCSPAVGLVCNNKDQKTPVGHCYDYEIRVRCCIYKCETTTTITATSPQRETTTPITQTKQPETTPIITEKTTSKPYIETSTSVTQTEKPTTTTTVTDKSKTPQPETTTPSTGTRTPQTMTVFTEKVTTKPYTETTTKETEKTSTKAIVTEKSTTLHIVTAPPITGTETPKTAPIITGEVTTTHYIETSTSITQTKKPTTTTTVTDNYKTPQPETTTPSTGTKTPQTMTVFTTSKPYIETTTPTMETEKPTTTITITEKSTTSHIGTTTQTTSIVNPTTTPIPTTISTTASETTTPDSCYICNWSKWTNNDYPGPSLDEGDYETIANISDVDLGLCKKPLEIQCRSKDYPDMPLKDLDQQVTCSPAVGLVCNNKDQKTPVGHCYDYEIRVRCCIYKCETTTTITATSPQRETTTPITQTKQPETTPIITEKTTSKPYIETSTSVTQTEKPTTTTTVTDKSKTPQPETTTPSTGTRTPQTMTVFTEKVTTKPYTETTTKETEKTSTKAIVTEKSTTLHIVTAPPITGTETPKTAPIITGEVTTTHYIETSTSITQTKKPTTTTTVTDNYKTPQPETTTPSTGTKTPQTVTVFTT
ncbi:uncharacterized protein V3H82_018687, partial [Fundulus diaphanus]